MPNAAGVGDDDELDPAATAITVMVEVEQEANKTTLLEEANPKSSDERTENRKKKRKRQLLKEAAMADKRGVCYLSRIPPHMDPLKLRQILSQYGEIQRIYLTPEDPVAQVHRKRAGGFRGVEFSEGWVEFSKRSIAKRVAKMLNGEQIGGRKRSAFFYDLWNIKYLSKFKWDDLTEEIAYKNAIREQKMALEISAAKRERDFYLSKVDQSRALISIEERMKKKRKLQQESGMTSELPQEKQAPKVIRQFPQTKPVSAGQSKPRLSRDILAGVLKHLKEEFELWKPRSLQHYQLTILLQKSKISHLDQRRSQRKERDFSEFIGIQTNCYRRSLTSSDSRTHNGLNLKNSNGDFTTSYQSTTANNSNTWSTTV
ncbi:unnamed protein product [Camellia sinensis]